MKNALILHGAGNNSRGNWFPWLKGKLEKRGYKVWVPDLPNSDNPITKDWLAEIFENPNWEFDSESVIIGHSAGATLILRILEHLDKSVKIFKAILVSGPIDKGTNPKFFKYKEDLTHDPFVWDKIKNSCNNFYFLSSDNDPYDCGQRHAKVMHEKLGGELIIKKRTGSF